MNVLQIFYRDKHALLSFETSAKSQTFIDPPGHGQIGGHYFHTWCPYVRSKNKKSAATPGTMCADNGHLLAVA